MTTRQRQLFIYYRIAEHDWREACAVVHGFQDALCSNNPDLSARVLRRAQPADGLLTVMEVYSLDAAAHPEGIDAQWLARIESAAQVMRAWQRGDRQTELFDAVD